MIAEPDTLKDQHKWKRRVFSSYSPMSYERIAILTALAAGPLALSEIYDAVITDTLAGVVIKKSSYYHLISELEKSGYLEKCGSFRLTDNGWKMLHQELNRIETQRHILKQRLHI